MKAAFRSRDIAIGYLRQLEEVHEPLGLRACGCGATGMCRTREILDRPWVKDRIRELERREHQRELEERFFPDVA